MPPSASVDLHGNASAFTVYAKVRQSVLVQGIRDASRLYHLANSGPGSDSESDDDGDEKNKEAQIKIPKVNYFSFILNCLCLVSGFESRIIRSNDNRGNITHQNLNFL